jgi:hypothetical protein
MMTLPKWSALTDTWLTLERWIEDLSIPNERLYDMSVQLKLLDRIAQSHGIPSIFD